MKNKVKGIVFTILLLTSTSFAFGQQAIWSTVEKDSLKRLNQYVPLNNVTKEVLEFYDMYDLYYDLTGYSKDEVLGMIQLSPAEQKKIKDVTHLTVMAMRTNYGKGSCVVVAIIDGENINMIIFANSAFMGGSFELTSDDAKFTKWFNTLLK